MYEVLCGDDAIGLGLVLRRVRPWERDIGAQNFSDQTVALNQAVVAPKAELRAVLGIVDRDFGMRAVHAVDPADSLLKHPNYGGKIEMHDRRRCLEVHGLRDRVRAQADRGSLSRSQAEVLGELPLATVVAGSDYDGVPTPLVERAFDHIEGDDVPVEG